MKVTFRASDHTYTTDTGELLPSVTQLLEQAVRPSGGGGGVDEGFTRGERVTYKLTTPCDQCPYLKKMAHVHCAGALIFLEKRYRPNQLMRISERLGMYDRTKLDMKAKVR